jgi:hypothetical protein
LIFATNSMAGVSDFVGVFASAVALTAFAQLAHRVSEDVHPRWSPSA